jgi:LuxR family maltose regulon positive regulatory protein
MTIIHDGTVAEWRPGVTDEPVPGRNPHYLARPHLLSRLDSRPAPVTVVSAPAGWGKITLLRAWTQTQNGRAVWIPPGSRATLWQRARTAVVTAAPALAGRIGQADAADTAAGLSGVLSGAQSPTALVVDDCNDVAGPDVLADLA